MSDSYQLTINDYKDIVKRRWLYFLLPFFIVLLLSSLIVYFLPSVYKSSGTILIESQQIPQDLIRTTVTSYADERIQVIKQRVTTRDNLYRIIKKFDLFSDENAELSVSEMAVLMREKIKINKSSIPSKRGRQSITIAFDLGYEDKNPKVALSVANELVTLFLQENVKTRTERAAETTEFLSQESEKLKKELENVEEQIALFKTDNQDALPEHLDLHVKMLERVENRIKEISRDIKSAEQTNRFLEIELSAAKKNTLNSNGINAGTSPEMELEKLKLQYAELITLYTDAHPDVKSVSRRMELLEKQIVAKGPTSDLEKNVYDNGIDVARIQARIDSTNEKIKSLFAQSAEQEQERKRLEGIIIETPLVQRQLISLTRDYENTLNKYNEIQNKEMEARLAESLEEGKKAERFTLIEPPVFADKPIKPNRQKMLVLAFFVSLAGAAGFVILLESLDKRIRGTEALTSLLKQRPIVSIPYITTSDELNKRKTRFKWLVIIFILLITAVVLLVHFVYMPLDLLFFKILVKFG